jgi:6-pyruvoyltetrahydropterin/6-carboxytetrahydropterin synthase
MYEIAIEDTFDAAHCLRGYDGACQRLHGHTYRVQVRFRVRELQESGIAIDFRRAKQILKGTLDHLDHQYINDLPEFVDSNPTAENIARFIYERVAGESTEIASVSVWETPTSCATYFREE